MAEGIDPDDYDGLGDVALGDTTGPSGRIGLSCLRPTDYR
jgi:hypothetical protein